MGLSREQAKRLGVKAAPVEIRAELQAAIEAANGRKKGGKPAHAISRAVAGPGDTKRPDPSPVAVSASPRPAVVWPADALARADRFRRSGQPEAAEQYLLGVALDRAGLRWAHVPNGGGRSAREGAELRELGVKPGVPDVLLFSRPRARPWIVGAAVEVKAPSQQTKTNPSSGTTEGQRDWLSALALEGWACTVAYSAEEAIGWLTTVGYDLEGM